MCRFNADWTVSVELDSWIQTIEETDSASTYYRYPMTKDTEGDKKKSSFKEKSAGELFPPDLPEGKKVLAMIVENEDREFVRGYVFDDGTEKESTEALLNAAEMLSNFHAMMRIELTGGT